jgi:hypothetical protein
VRGGEAGEGEKKARKGGGERERKGRGGTRGGGQRDDKTSTVKVTVLPSPSTTPLFSSLCSHLISFLFCSPLLTLRYGCRAVACSEAERGSPPPFRRKRRKTKKREKTIGRRRGGAGGRRGEERRRWRRRWS